MPESLMKGPINNDGTYRAGERGWYSASRNNTKVETDADYDAKDGWGTADSASPRAMKTLEAIETLNGLAGATYISWKKDGSVSYFQMDNTKNYVFKMDIKDNNPDETAPKLNFCVWNENVQSRAWSKEYGEAGFAVTGEYKTYAGTFDLPDSFDNTSTNAITAGFMAPVAAGESISFDTSAKGKVYFAEEVAYDIKNVKTSTETGLFAGDTATFESSIVNQIDSEGYLDQNVEWLVLDESRSEEISGFTIETDASSQKATVTVGDTVEKGTYAVVAYSEKYDMAMGREIKVYDENYYKDYVKGEMPASLMKWAAPTETEANRPGERGWMAASRNCQALDTDKNFDGTVLQIGWGTGGSYSPRAIYTLAAITGENATEEGPAYGYNTVGGDGMASIVYTAYKADRAVNYFKMDNSKNYVFRVYIKDNYPGVGEAPLVNFAVSNDNVAGRAWSKEYGAEGFRVTGEYQAYAGTFDLPDTFNNDGVQTVSSGFMIGNGAGESISYKTGNLGDIYFAEEVAYDIKNEKVSGPEKLQTGNSATFETSIVNQVGSEGYLVQDFDWYVMDTERKEFIDGFTIDVDAATKKATVTPGASVPTGRYDVVAVSDKYAMAKGQTIRVIADDYYNDYQKKAAPENIYETIYGTNIPNGIMQRNTADVNVNKDNAPVYNFFASANISYGQYNAINGWITNKLSNTESYNKFEVGKSYLFKVRAKDASTNGEAAAINAVIHNETSSVMTHNWPVEKPSHSDGYVLTDEYADYIFTIPVGTNFDANAGKHFLTFGFAGGTLSGAAFDIDFSVDDAIYLAEEVVYDIKNEVKAGQTSLKAGETVTLEASVVNQLDKEGTLEQNFTWVAMDTNRKNIIEGITVTPNADTTEATVTVADTVAVGTYTIVAVSEDYDIAKGININVAAAAEKISAFEMKEDSGYVMLDATVVD